MVDYEKYGRDNMLTSGVDNIDPTLKRLKVADVDQYHMNE